MTVLHPDKNRLLRACLSSGQEAVSSWESWRQRVDFDAIDGDSFRLMPLLHWNLRREGINDPLMGRIKGIHRHTWSRNQLLFHAGAQALRTLENAGIPVLVLKGAALALAQYPDSGLRPMEDLDFLVPSTQVSRAAGLLHRNGWRCMDSPPVPDPSRCIHASRWENAEGQQIDLHWRLVPSYRQPDEDGVWKRAVPVGMAGQTFMALGPADLLWTVCSQGGLRDAVVPIRWVADAWFIVHRMHPPDWSVFTDEVRLYDLAHGVRMALHFLRVEFNLPIPESVLGAMAVAPLPWHERWAARYRQCPRRLAGALPLHLVHYALMTREQSLTSRIADLPRFFQRLWRQPSAWSLPCCFIKKSLQRIRSHFH